VTLARRAAVAGVIVWAAATALLVPLGHRLFGPDNAAPVSLWATLIVLGTFGGVVLLARGSLRRTGSGGLAAGALFGAFVCAPGLLLDGALYAFAGGSYPGLGAHASGAMTATLLFAYAAALAASLAAGARLKATF
jgi:hypothetical protein